MAISIKETVNELIDKTNIGGQLKDLFRDRFSSGASDLRFPSDIMSAEQSHYVRFGIVKTQGADFSTVTGGGGGKTQNVTEEEEGGGGAATTGLLSAITNSPVTRRINDIGQGAKPALSAIANIAGGSGTNIGGIASKLNGLLGNIGTPPVAIRTEEVGSIILFMPEQISDTFSTSWSSTGVGTVGAAIISGELSLDNKTIQDITSNLPLLGKELGSKIIGSLTGQDNIDKLILRDKSKTGTPLAVNPLFEIFFNDVNVRTFSFLFRLAPKSPEEAKTIQQIVSAFKYFSAPSFLNGAAGRYYRYPNQFTIEYHNEEFLNKISPCALTSITVNYNQTAGSNVTFHDGRPLETTLSLSFQELSFQTKETFKEGF